VSVRVARDDDWPAIREVQRAAFGAHDVGPLIEELRADPALYVPELSFVATARDAVVGHVMSTWCAVGDSPVLQLSPLGVHPDHQGQGHGSALVRATLAAVREPLLMLEGNPAYYGRFGFVRALDLGILPPPETLVEWALQVAVLDETRPLPQGRARYSDPFTRELVVRAARAEDLDATLGVERAAFGRDDEAEMVRAARASDGHVPELDLVAVQDRRIVGHALTTWFALEGSGRRVLELAPLAVAPDYQGRGIGGALVRATLDRARRLGEAAVLVLGHPSYYPRFGFEHASAHGLLPPEGIPDEAFMVAVLGDDVPRGRVVFPPALS
jgi:predicted N-acetyltransferase YhbS